MKYNLKQDHKAIKQQIKKWELEINSIQKALYPVYNDSTLGDVPLLQKRLETLSHEMMAINI